MRLHSLMLVLALGAACQSKKNDQPAPTTATETPADDAAAAREITAETPAPELIEAISTYEGHILDSVQAAIAACRVLGQRPEPAALDAMVAVVQKALPELDPGHAVRAACAQSLGAYDDDRATDTLLALLAASGESLPVRSAALAGLGDTGDPRAVPAIVELLVTHAGVGDSARRALAAIGEPAVEPVLALLRDAPPAGVEPGTAAFVAARVLGDLRADQALPALIASLDKDPMPAMVGRGGEAGPSHHVAVIEALRQIGGPAAARALRAYASSSKEPSLTTLALDAYSQVAAGGPDPAHLETLSSEGADQQVRVAAGLAYARRATDQKQIEALVGLASELDRMRPLIGGLIARAHVGAVCKADVDCLKENLTSDNDALVAALTERYPVLKDLAPAQQAELPAAARESALIQVRHLGEQGRPLLDAVLAAAGSEYRMVQQTALDALAAIAPEPCPECVTALDAILARPDSRPIAGPMALAVAATRHHLSR